MFYKVAVIEGFAKFTGKYLCWSHFLIIGGRAHHKCFLMKCFFYSPLKMKQRLSVNKLTN